MHPTILLVLTTVFVISAGYFVYLKLPDMKQDWAKHSSLSLLKNFLPRFKIVHDFMVNEKPKPGTTRAKILSDFESIQRKLDSLGLNEVIRDISLNSNLVVNESAANDLHEGFDWIAVRASLTHLDKDLVEIETYFSMNDGSTQAMEKREKNLDRLRQLHHNHM